MSNTTTPAAPATKQDRNITDGVLSRISQFQEAGELVLPKNYSAENALKSAYLVLVELKDKDGKPVLESCSKDSIANSLFKMVTEGLSVAKRQGSFIAYGGKLSWQREYAGNIAMARRVAGLNKIKGNAIFKGDEFEFEVDEETGRRKLIHHKQTLESIGSGVIVGAYAITELEDGTKDMEVMTWDQIQKAWAQGHAKGGSPAHKNFADQMAAKTVINRACKLLINTSDDAHLYEDSTEDIQSEVVRTTIGERANREVLTIDPDPAPVSVEEKEEELTGEEKNPI
ncbi:recombinase RecT [Chitinophaga niabensis]|uniref:recombinase RecT n=1 Tax=Chitinophaga niabensis TaxID=536979 RepID=UPI0031BA3FA5